jgi:uncharacterized protein YceH (UPF0502 family)
VHDLDPVELRVLGSLIEKQRTTPDAYPLTLNSLRAACNQSTNRDPVVSYDDATIREALHRLGRRRWTRLAGAGRAAKYRHLLDEALGLSGAEQSLLAVLMLRGPQTLGELHQRTERLHRFSGTAEIEQLLESLASRELAVRVGRRPGQREERYAHLLGDRPDEEAEPAPPPAPAGDSRLDRLERELTELRAEVAALRAAIGSG